MTLWIAETDPVELHPNPTVDDLDIVIRAAYRQVLGNAHIMESERLINAESQLRNSDITVRGFVRAIAQSDLYRSLFFNSSCYRFIELNFKHLLGRAPQDQTEIAAHVQTNVTQGYRAEIDSYIDSAEYEMNFGENLVPYHRGSRTQTGVKNVSFNRTFSLMRGYSTSDLGKPSRLTSDIAGNLPTPITFPASVAAPYTNRAKNFRITIVRANYGSRVTKSAATLDVGYAQLSKNIQNIQKSGGKILSITEIA
jgi:phycoerythrin-associated linker protein